MVVLKEFSNMFWGVTLDGGKRYSQTVDKPFHLSMAALESNPHVNDKSQHVQVMLQHESSEFLLCTLGHGNVLQQQLDISFSHGEDITFYLNGGGVVHLTGSLLEDLEDGPYADDYDDDDVDSDLQTPQLTMADEDENDESDDEDWEPAITPGSKRKIMDILKNKGKKLKMMDCSDEDESEEYESSFIDDDAMMDDDDSEEEDEDSEDEEEDEEDNDSVLEEVTMKKKPSASPSTPASSKKDRKSGATPQATPGSSKKKEKTPKKSKASEFINNDAMMDDDDDDSEEEVEDSDEEDNDSFLEEVTMKKKPSASPSTPASSKKDRKSGATPQATPGSSKKKEKTPKKSKASEAEETPVANGAGDQPSKKKKKKKKKKVNTEEVPQKQQTPEETPPSPKSSPAPGKKRTVSGGIGVEDVKIGHGPEAKPGKNVSVYYVGTLAKNNKRFDSCEKGKPFRFRLGRGEVIKGWDTGLIGMKVGGKRRITVPPSQGYGNSRQGPIPPGSTLVFDVEMKAVN